MNEDKTVVILGGGVFGCSTAIELVNRGYSVTLVEPTALEGPNPFASSTDISKLVRSDYGGDKLYCELNTEAIRRWKLLNKKWNENLYHECGLLNLTINKAESGSYIDESYNMLKEKGYPIEKLDEAEINKRFPQLHGFRDGYFNNLAGWAESGEVVARLLKEAKQIGVHLMQDEMNNLIYASNNDSNTKGRVIGVQLKSGTRIEAKFVVVAAGAWTPTLLPWLAPFFSPSLQSVFHFQPSEPVLDAFSEDRGFSGFCADITKTGYYGFPTHPKERVIKIGHHSLGLPMKIGELTPANIRRLTITTRDSAEAKFRAFLREHIPQLATAPAVQFRLCPYEDTIDGHFLIDHDPLRPGLVVAAGGSGHGFKFTPVLGEIISDVVEGKPNRYAHRFAWRFEEGKEPVRAFDVCRFVEPNVEPVPSVQHSAL